MAQDEYGTADMTWHKIRTLLDDHYLQLDISNNLTQDLDDLMPDLDRIIMHMTKNIRIVWNFTRDSMATRSTLGNILTTPEYNWWTREFYVWQILILGKPVNFAGNHFDSWRLIKFRHNGYHRHTYPSSRGDITITRFQDYSRLKETLASARFRDRVKTQSNGLWWQSNGLWWYWLVWLSILSILICWIEYDYGWLITTWRWYDLIWWLQFDYNNLWTTTMMFMIMTDMLMNNILMPRFNSLRLASMGFTSWVDYYQWHSSPGLCVLPLTERMFHYELDLWQFSTRGDRTNPDRVAHNQSDVDYSEPHIQRR